MKVRFQTKVSFILMAAMNVRGISLLENLIAVVILVLIVFGMVGIFVSGRQNIGHSRNLVAASELCRYYIEPLQMQVRYDTWADAGNCLGTKNGTACDTASQNINGIIFTPAYEISDAPGTSAVRKVKLTITWTEPN